MSAMDVPAEGPGVAEAGARTARAVSAPRMTWLTLALMTTSSVASLRSAPTMAVYGLACVFLYIVPAIVFLLPTALVSAELASAELASGWNSGVYNWVPQGLSKPLGFLAVWCQFAMTIFYYPSLLAYVASTIAYVINPALASSALYTAIVIMVLYWTGVWVSSHGTDAVAGPASWGLVIGTLIPGVLLVVLGMVFLGQGNASAAPMNATHLFPAWTGLASLVLIVNNFLSYSGKEMNAVHVSSLKNPAKEFPKSMFVAHCRCGAVSTCSQPGSPIQKKFRPNRDQTPGSSCPAPPRIPPNSRPGRMNPNRPSRRETTGDPRTAPSQGPRPHPTAVGGLAPRRLTRQEPRRARARRGTGPR